MCVSGRPILTVSGHPRPAPPCHQVLARKSHDLQQSASLKAQQQEQEERVRHTYTLADAPLHAPLTLMSRTPHFVQALMDDALLSAMFNTGEQDTDAMARRIKLMATKYIAERQKNMVGNAMQRARMGPIWDVANLMRSCMLSSRNSSSGLKRRKQCRWRVGTFG